MHDNLILSLYRYRLSSIKGPIYSCVLLTPQRDPKLGHILRDIFNYKDRTVPTPFHNISFNFPI